MTRKSPSPTAAGLAALALVGSLQLTTVAHAAPTAPEPQAPVAPAPQAPAQSPTDPTLTGLDLAPAKGTVSVDGRSMTVIASLGVTQKSFTMAALTWTATTGRPVFQVRARTATGWGEWQTLEHEKDGGDTASTRARRQGTEPLWLDASTAVEARVLGTGTETVTSPRLSLVDTRVTASDSGLMVEAQQAAASTSGDRVTAAASSTTYATAPAIISRAQWGADESLLSYNGSGCVPAAIDTTIKAAIVHHTAGSNSYTASQSASIVRGIYAFHVKDRGWCDIGYNFLVDKYGQIFEGRHGGIYNPVHGAHATSWNTNTVGVSVMMNSSTAVQTPEAVSAVTRVLAWKLAGNYRPAGDKLTLAGTYINRIARHGDVMSTSCPGTNLTAYMPTLRQRVAAAMGTWQTPIYQLWQAKGGESGTLGSPHVMERPWNGGRTTTFTGGGIYQTPTGRTFWMGRAINQRYMAYGAFGALGWPTGSQTTPTTGVVRTTFQRGVITWSSTTGAHATTGTVNTWLAAHPTEAARLGLPTGEFVGTATSGSQRFQNGTLTVNGTSVSVTWGNGLQGDLDSDGRADLLTVGSGNAITWYPTTSTGAAGAPRTGDTLGGAAITWVAQTPDVNGDGKTELMARRSDGTLWAWWGAGLGRYTSPRQVGYGWNSMREINVVPDMNRDGLPEIVAISPTQSLVRYQLGRQLTVVNTQQIGQRWTGVVHMTSVGDFRRVGVTDILGITSDGRLWDYKGSGTGTVSDGVQVGYGWQGFTQVRSLGDLNGDGHWDLVGNKATGALWSYRSNAGSFGDRFAMLAEVSGRGLLA